MAPLGAGALGWGLAQAPSRTSPLAIGRHGLVDPGEFMAHLSRLGQRAAMPGSVTWGFSFCQSTSAARVFPAQPCATNWAAPSGCGLMEKLWRSYNSWFYAPMLLSSADSAAIPVDQGLTAIAATLVKRWQVARRCCTPEMGLPLGCSGGIDEILRRWRGSLRSGGQASSAGVGAAPRRVSAAGADGRWHCRHKSLNNGDRSATAGGAGAGRPRRPSRSRQRRQSASEMAKAASFPVLRYGSAGVPLAPGLTSRAGSLNGSYSRRSSLAAAADSQTDQRMRQFSQRASGGWRRANEVARKRTFSWAKVNSGMLQAVNHATRVSSRESEQLGDS